MKLDFGAGEKRHREEEGYLAVDINPETKPDILLDFTKLPLPFEDGSIEAVYMSHVLEHLAPKHALELMEEIARILQPEGLFECTVPDLEKACELFLSTPEEKRWQPAIHGLIYGQPDVEFMGHKTGYTAIRLAVLTTLVGLKVELATPCAQGQAGWPSVMLRARKPLTSTSSSTTDQSSTSLAHALVDSLRLEGSRLT